MKMLGKYGFRKWAFYFLLILAGIVSFVTVANYVIVGESISKFIGYLSPFIAGGVIAFLLDIPCSWIDKRFIASKNEFISKNSRPISVVTTFVITILLVTLLLVIAIPAIADSAKKLARDFPEYYADAVSFIKNIDEAALFTSLAGLEVFIKNIAASIIDYVSVNGLGGLLEFEFIHKSISGVLSVSNFLLKMMIALISSVYLLFESNSIKAFFRKFFHAILPEKISVKLFKYVNFASVCFKKFFFCLLIDGFIVGVISVAGLQFLGVEYALILGVVEGVLNMIPYFGAIVGSVIVAFIVLFTDGFGKAVVVGIFLLIVQQIDGNIIKIKLFGDSFKMSPFLVFFSITIGGVAFGIAGMVLAIPFTAVTITMLDDFLEFCLRKKEEKKAKEEKNLMAKDEKLLIEGEE